MATMLSHTTRLLASNPTVTRVRGMENRATRALVFRYVAADG